MNIKDDIILRLGRNPLLAHRALFRHRHDEETKTFHAEMIADWHSDLPRVLTIAFRGSAKSTTAEEAIIVMACLQKFNNGLIVGETEPRAQEKLSSIRHEFETNENIFELFGDLKGRKWQETFIELSNGTVLRAVGRGQSIRGVKHRHYRPDMAFIDDLEDEESVRSVEGREGTLRWFMSTFVPALHPRARIRMAATPLHPDALALKLERSENWSVRKYPILAISEKGEEYSVWPERYSLAWCRAKRKEYEVLGQRQIWNQEFMCEAESAEDKLFKPEMFRSEPLLKTWQPVYVVYDPARTVKSTSAMTGKVAGSWINNRLVLWEASGHFWKPDEIIDDIFKMDDKYAPVEIGVEENGLHEFIMQPLRHAQALRGHPVPIKSLLAPKGKIDFIGSLQPYFKAGEVIFAGDRAAFQELETQLLAFPSGRKDIPNALAYFLKLRPGVPIYDTFTQQNIEEDIKVRERYPVYLCVNATNAMTTAALVQVCEGLFFILQDYIREGDPGAVLKDIVREAGVFSRRDFTLVAPPRHFQTYDFTGLVKVAKQIPVTISAGRTEIQGREELRRMIQQLTHYGVSQFRISSKATWTLRAFTGGYARDAGKEHAIDNTYKILCEGIESFAGLITAGLRTDEDRNIRYDVTKDGRRYMSAMRA